jgi:hypothetical protein
VRQQSEEEEEEEEVQPSRFAFTQMDTDRREIRFR